MLATYLCLGYVVLLDY